MSIGLFDILNSPHDDAILHEVLPPRVAAGYIRYGTVATTDFTTKAEIAGLPCGVRTERKGLARVYVFTTTSSGRQKAEGPYELKSCDIE